MISIVNSLSLCKINKFSILVQFKLHIITYVIILHNKTDTAPRASNKSSTLISYKMYNDSIVSIRHYKF